MKILRLLIPIVVLAFFGTSSNASHVMGSDISWECIGKDTFRITVAVYRDCNGVNLSATAVTLKSNCGTKSASTSMGAGRDITPVCDEQCTRCDSRGCSFQYGIQAFDLTTVVILSDWRKNGCCEVTLSWTQCCRNGAITTGASNQNFYVEAKLNICQDPCDNSPTFTGDPLAIICLGRDFIYNQGVQDKDIDPKTGGLADSLVYSWAEPLQTASSKTSWSSGYAYNKPLYYLGFPKTGLKFPRGMHLDSVTGDMMFRPMKVEQTVMTIKIEEYRDGKLIGITRRDIQVVVIKCPDNNPPVISGINCKLPKPENFKIDACAEEKLCFTICTSDKDKNDTVVLSWNAGIPGATFTIVNKGDRRETGRFCWTPTEAQVSKFPYTFVAIAKDNACPVNSISARSFSITVKEPPKAVYDTLIYDCGEARFTARKTGKINISQYMWNLSGRVVVHKGGNEDTVYHHYKYPGKKAFSLTLIGGNGCNKLYEDTVTVPDYVNVTTSDDVTVCAGASVQVSASVGDAVGSYKVEWSTGESYTNKGGTASITVGKNDTFVVAKVTDTQCENWDTTFISVNRPVKFDLGNEVRICPGTTHYFKPTTFYDTTETDTIFRYYWYQDELTSPISTMETFGAKDSATYFLIIADSLNCRSMDSVVLKVNPERKWLPDGKTICFKEKVTLSVKETSKGSTFEWWNNIKDTINSPIYIGESYTDKPSQSLNYGIRWTETLMGLTCTKFDSVSVKVNALPSIKIERPSDVCENGEEFSLIYNATPYGGLWFDTVSNKELIKQNKFYPKIAGANGTLPKLHNLFYTYQDPITKCKDTVETAINVKPLPIVELSEDTIAMCNTEDPRDLGQYVVKVAGQGKWSGSGVNLIGSKYVFDGSLVNNIQGYYRLIYSYEAKAGTQPYCSNEDTLYLHLIEVPEAIAGVYDSVCLNTSSFSLNKQSPKGVTGQWYYRGKDKSKWEVATETFSPFDKKEGQHFYGYVFTVPGSVCRDTAYTSITVNPLPKPQILTTWKQGAGLNKICFSDDPKLLLGNTIENGEGYTDYLWSGRGVRALTGSQYEFGPATAGLGSHTLTYTVTNNFGCVDYITQNVTVDPIKKIGFSNERVCNGDTVQLKLTVENSAEVLWTTSGDGEFVNNRALNAKYIALGKDLLPENTFEISVVTDNIANVCAEARFTSEIRVHPLPNVKFTCDTLVCAPFEVIFNNNSTIKRGSIREYKWLYGDGNKQIVVGEKRVTSNVYGVIGTNDTYTAKLIATSDEGCVDSAERKIITLLTPEAAYRPQPGVTTIIRPEVYFKNLSKYVAFGKSMYSWNFDDYSRKPDGGISQEESPLYRYTDTGSYYVRLVATNFHTVPGGIKECSDTIIRMIRVKPEILIYIPNAFSPDGKGIDANETFRPIVSNSTDYSVQIFNRWGQKMWESIDPEESWDGNSHGAACMPDVYLYVVKVRNEDGRDYEFTGTVTLLR